ncbi:hypothetical protein [Thalassovita taeanensis]|nr:hypothetical protein [Thalassovita taeanensis]
MRDLVGHGEGKYLQEISRAGPGSRVGLNDNSICADTLRSRKTRWLCLSPQGDVNRKTEVINSSADGATDLLGLTQRFRKRISEVSFFATKARFLAAAQQKGAAESDAF